MYRWLPLGTIINSRVLVVHGGISDTTNLDLIKSLDRGKVSLMKLFLYLESKQNQMMEKLNINSSVFALLFT